MREDDPAEPTAGRAARRAICSLALPDAISRLRRKMDAAVPQSFDPETRAGEYFASGLSSAQSSLDQWVGELLHVLRRASHPPAAVGGADVTAGLNAASPRGKK
jgi:hypothetical protein